MDRDDIRIGLIGAGYIAGWHAEAVRATAGLRLGAVCDAQPEAGRALADALGVPFFPAVAAMAGAVDAVHVLTPPATHAALASEALGAGLHVLVEKPMATTLDEVAQMQAAAAAAGRQLAVGHNFLGLPAWRRLRRLVDAGVLGRISSVRVDWALPFAPLRSGPSTIWPLRDEGNLLLELGPHPMGFVVDLFGRPQIDGLFLTQPIDLPGGAGVRHQGWRIIGRAGAVDVTLHLSLVETLDDRSVTLRGSSGIARMDFARDTLTLERDNSAELVLSPLLRELSLAGQHLREGVVNAARQGLSLNRRQPYALSFRATAAAFRDQIRRGTPDPAIGAPAAAAVMAALHDAIALLPPAPPAPAIRPLARRPDVMVIGGTGYIGRALVRALVAQGHGVRVLSRGRTGPFGDLGHAVETLPVAPSDEAGLTDAMQGIGVVFNLARALEKTWAAALAHDVGATLAIGRAAAAAGVGHLVHAGTIASYDMSDPRLVITEATDFGPLEARNLYARSKAEGERRLTLLAGERGLALTIARPGIVVGGDGPLQHWGIGRWHGAGAVRLWGDGRNPLPFVLVDDLAGALVRMIGLAQARGTSFNLTGDVELSAREWFDLIHSRTGARIHVRSGSLGAMWLADRVKGALKTHVLRRADALAVSRADWLSRGHLSRFDNRHAKAILGWQPEADRVRFGERAVAALPLFGL
ncbi:MAG: Gfo/Idh/MocA family oxidoreductase [Rubellimicrobium sp.]|nr:Gfo/Idh/MocA family oxidoreductase [Rubellimicrobium sp.]